LQNFAAERVWTKPLSLASVSKRLARLEQRLGGVQFEGPGGETTTAPPRHLSTHPWGCGEGEGL
jgi:hypothetical protein